MFWKFCSVEGWEWFVRFLVLWGFIEGRSFLPLLSSQMGAYNRNTPVCRFLVLCSVRMGCLNTDTVPLSHKVQRMESGMALLGHYRISLYLEQC